MEKLSLRGKRISPRSQSLSLKPLPVLWDYKSRNVFQVGRAKESLRGRNEVGIDRDRPQRTRAHPRPQCLCLGHGCGPPQCGWAWPLLTVHPADADTLKDSHKEKAHPTGGIGVKELEDVHASLWDRRTNTWTEGWTDTRGSRVSQLALERTPCSDLCLPSARNHFLPGRMLLSNP